MKIEETRIPGLLLVRSAIQHNDDGWFKENWHRQQMVDLGLPDFDPVQHNVTNVADRGITRGFHAEPWDRLVSLVRGRAMGAWVDLRRGPGFGQTFWCDLDRGTSVFVPRGVANAHQVLEDDTTFSYLLEHHWTPQSRHQSGFVNLFDPKLDIPWAIGADRAIVAHRDTLHPFLEAAKAVEPRRMLVVGTETPLARALVAELPGAHGLTTQEMAADAARPVDLSAYDVLIDAHGATGSGSPDQHQYLRSWDEAAFRAHRLTDIARRHHLRYVLVTADCVFEHAAPEHSEREALSLHDRRGQSQAAAELVGAGVPRHLLIRTGWVIGRDEGYVEELVAAARRGTTPSVLSDRHGRLTFASQLAAGITHLLDVVAPAGTYNVTGDGRVASWVEVAQRVTEICSGAPGEVRPVQSPSGEAAPPPSAILDLEKIKATGFRPGNSWLELIDHLPRSGSQHPGVAERTGAEGSEEPEDVDGLLQAGADPSPYKVMFVCTANIARSAYADVVAQGSARPGLEFGSAGTRALVGRAIDPPMANLVGDKGAPEAHRARQLTRELLADADLVLAMSADHRRYILDEWPALGRKAFVIGHVARELAELPPEVTLSGLVDHLWRHRSAAPEDEVADPYGRGEAAAAVAARRIDGHLDAILGRLAGLVERGN